ncbi:hypothetical protein [Pseudarthrobacter sp. N5]|uniref:hypothetical protein n=1 Tax=Pseudarthrobacter sp. N5 TaxID=3418416 RepID=UPI003CEAEB2B
MIQYGSPTDALTASWSAFIAWNGFEWNAVSGNLHIDAAAEDTTTFWTAGGAWGTWTQHRNGHELVYAVHVAEGVLPLKAIYLHGLVAHQALKQAP